MTDQRPVPTVYLTPPPGGYGIPLDVTSTLLSAIGQLWPGSSIGGGAGPGRGIGIVIPDAARNASPPPVDRNAAFVAADTARLDAGINGVTTDGDEFSVSVNTPRDAFAALASWAYLVLTESGPANYVEQSATDPETGRRFTVAACWTEDQTPHQLRMVAESRAEQAEAALAACNCHTVHET